jgi:thioredoxin reductase
VLRVDPDSVTLAGGEGEIEIPNDRVFVLIGGELPTRFLQECGVEIDVKFGVP